MIETMLPNFRGWLIGYSAAVRKWLKGIREKLITTRLTAFMQFGSTAMSLTH